MFKIARQSNSWGILKHSLKMKFPFHSLQIKHVLMYLQEFLLLLLLPLSLTPFLHLMTILSWKNWFDCTVEIVFNIIDESQMKAFLFCTGDNRSPRNLKDLSRDTATISQNQTCIILVFYLLHLYLCKIGWQLAHKSSLG